MNGDVWMAWGPPQWLVAIYNAKRLGVPNVHLEQAFSITS